MAVTKSWEAKVLAFGTESGEPRRIGWREFAWLAAASLLVSIGLALVYSAKTHNFGDLASRLDRGELLDLNSVSKPEQLLPFLQIFPSETERQAAANKTFEFLTAHRPIRNVGALARLRGRGSVAVASRLGTPRGSRPVARSTAGLRGQPHPGHRFLHRAAHRHQGDRP